MPFLLGILDLSMSCGGKESVLMVFLSLRRCTCLPCMVRHLFRLHPQKGPVFDRTARKVHSLEVSTPSKPIFLVFLLSVLKPLFPFFLFTRQTVFYTPSTITISAGEHITGSLTCAPNAKNNRDLDITIRWKAPKEDGTDAMDTEEEVRYQMCV